MKTIGPPRWVALALLLFSVSPIVLAAAPAPRDPNYFRRLDITEEASAEEMKSAYRAAAMIYHPDRAPQGQVEQYTELFKRISEAYETLSDPKKRAHYEETLARFSVGGASRSDSGKAGASRTGNGSTSQAIDPESELEQRMARDLHHGPSYEDQAWVKIYSAPYIPTFKEADQVSPQALADALRLHQVRDDYFLEVAKTDRLKPETLVQVLTQSSELRVHVQIWNTILRKSSVRDTKFILFSASVTGLAREMGRVKELQDKDISLLRQVVSHFSSEESFESFLEAWIDYGHRTQSVFYPVRGGMPTPVDFNRYDPGSSGKRLPRYPDQDTRFTVVDPEPYDAMVKYFAKYGEKESPSVMASVMDRFGYRYSNDVSSWLVSWYACYPQDKARVDALLKEKSKERNGSFLRTCRILLQEIVK